MKWRKIDAFYRQKGTAPALNPQHQFAGEYFDFYLKNRPSQLANTALQQAFLMWGNLPQTSRLVDNAMGKIPENEDIWEMIADGALSSYARDKRFTANFTDIILIERFLEKNAGPKSNHFLTFRLAEAQMDAGQTAKAIQGFQKTLSAHQNEWYVKNAKGHLHELQSLNAGMQAPAFTTQDINGMPVELRQYQGKIVLLFFWASDCGPCYGELPHLKEIAKQYSERVQIIAISGDSSQQELRRTIYQESLQWININENPPYFGPISSQYSILRYPTIYILDKNGRIAAKHVREKEILEKIKRLLA